MATGTIGNGTGGHAPGSSGTSAEVRTLADLARIAGVSAGTVSRALAGKALVNVETRERIQALARQYGFRPNQMASKLRTRRTGVIGVVLPLGHAIRQHSSGAFFLTLLGHLADELAESGYDVMLSRAEPDGTSEWLERVTGSGMVDGVLLIGQADQSEVIEAVSANYRPMVTWGARREGQSHCVVGTDHITGGRLAAEHLIGTGARKLVFLGDTRSVEIEKRYRGAAGAADEAGVPMTHVPIALAGDEMSGQLKAAVAAFGRDVDGIVAATDLLAINAVNCLHEQGRRVPEDVQVVGFDDLPLAAMAVPPLTSVRQDIAVGARAMVERLKARIEGERSGSLTMPPRLIVRETTRAA